MNALLLGKRFSLAALCAALTFTAGWPGNNAAAQTPAAVSRPSDQTIRDAYTYLLGRLLVIRQEQLERKDACFNWNTIKYNPLASTDLANPNFDMVSLDAWIATDQQSAVLLEVPQIEGRYYTVQLLDEWGEVIANINKRTFTSQPYGRFALVQPGAKVDIPADAARIQLHSSKAKLLARVAINADPAAAMTLQKRFRLTPQGDIIPVPTPAVPPFDNAKLLGVKAFDNVDAILSSALDIAPNAAQLQQQVRVVARYVASSPSARAIIDEQLNQTVVPDFIKQALAQGGPVRNYWVGGAPTGNYGSNYRLRTVLNYLGIWSNVSDEGVDFIAANDVTGKPLNGSKSYVIRFAADSLPSAVVDAYWSVTLLGMPDLRAVPNPLNRFNLNSDSNLTKNSDGSLSLAIGPKPVNGIADTNWLPSASNKGYALILRTYVPKDLLKQGKWAPPGIIEVK